MASARGLVAMMAGGLLAAMVVQLGLLAYNSGLADTGTQPDAGVVPYTCEWKSSPRASSMLPLTAGTRGAFLACACVAVATHLHPNAARQKDHNACTSAQGTTEPAATGDPISRPALTPGRIPGPCPQTQPPPALPPSPGPAQPTCAPACRGCRWWCRPSTGRRRGTAALHLPGSIP